jgi:parvulin-like peptidyl-prolyl isomerase
MVSGNDAQAVRDPIVPAGVQQACTPVTQIEMKGYYTMRRVLCILIVAAAVTVAQTNTPSHGLQNSTPARTKTSAGQAQAALSPKAAGHAASTDNPVPSNRAVVTIHGLCDRPAGNRSKAANAGDCATVVTRRQLDTVIDNLRVAGQVLAPTMRRNIAQGYADLMIYSEAARKAGMDKDPRFQQILEFARMRALTDMYRIRLEEQAKKISAQEIAAYYKNNLDKFEELHLRRITLPRYNTANLKDEDFAARAKHLAGDVRDRAAKGEDLDKLQNEAFETLGIKKPPTTSMAPIRRGMYRAEEETELFSLKPGGVSPVTEEPSTYIIFKLESRGTPTLAEVKEEIKSKLQDQKLESLKNAITSSVQVDYDDQYLGPAPPHPGWVPLGPAPGTQGAARQPAPSR